MKKTCKFVSLKCYQTTLLLHKHLKLDHFTHIIIVMDCTHMCINKHYMYIVYQVNGVQGLKILDWTGN